LSGIASSVVLLGRVDGKKGVRALHIVDGKEVWNEPVIPWKAVAGCSQDGRILALQEGAGSIELVTPGDNHRVKIAEVGYEVTVLFSADGKTACLIPELREVSRDKAAHTYTLRRPSQAVVVIDVKTGKRKRTLELGTSSSGGDN